MLLSRGITLDAAGQMALDEAVLGLAPDGAGFLRIYDWAGQAVTFGLAQPFAMAQGAAQAKGMAGMPIVRRPTGGGIVFHDGDLTFSVVFPWERLSSALGVYERMHRAIGEALASRGLETAVAGFAVPPPLLAPPAGGGELNACFAEPSPFDLLTSGGKKLLGGALRRKPGRGLYQGSLRPELSGLGTDALRKAVAEGVRAAWPCAWLEAPEASWLAEAGRLTEKYRSDEWNRRR
ncbi:MAG: hypothetical protein HZB91_10500 [Elusimicrobia bacterium]|nr:hypothetical protein [Elusimicrobiota bacterium]